ncbi:transposase [Natrinema longum]|uniref:Transposase n=1 Tax=Natrinema longum TaxID=370324 RepID=A0A8A2U6F5_9EURY|nr:transposase [Natrinema longum]MBZ6494855.1 transposase [Natrinema longum]QSW83845.1 transposase [Natrinema longum]
MPQADAELEIDPDPRLEREAEEAAQQAMADGPVTINRMGSEMHIQRSAKGETEYVTKDEVLEIVDNYYRGHVEEQAESDPTAAGPERDTARGSLEQSSSSAESSGFFGKMREAWENTKSVGSDLSQAMTKGAIGSLAGAGGKIVGKVGGGSLGALLGGAVGSLAGPVGTGAGAAVGYQIGGTLGGEILGGAAGDVAKQLTDYSLPNEHAASVADLQQKYQALEEKVKQLENEQMATGGGRSRGLSQSISGGN